MRRSFILSCVALVVLAVLNFCLWRLIEAERIESVELRARQNSARRAARDHPPGSVVVRLSDGRVFVDPPESEYEYNPPGRDD